jgi:integrase
MANQLPSGRWRGRVRHPKHGRQVSPSTIIGGPTTYASRREAERAEDRARDQLLGAAARGTTVREWWTEWTTSPLWKRPSESTNLHYAERTRAFVERYGDRPIASVTHADIADWLKGGAKVGTADKLRTMFGDAMRHEAGALVATNPFSGLRLRRTRGRKDVQPPDVATVARMLAAADELTPPSFAAYLLTACYSAARPGELDALMLTDLDFMAETIDIERQWSAKLAAVAPPKHGSRRVIAMTEPVRKRLSRLPRESEWVFTTIRGNHYVPSTRAHHWNRVRCAVGLGNTSLYLATRHFYAWYAFNVLELPDHVIALQLGHTDGGGLVRRLYGHPDAAIARRRTRDAFRSTAQVEALPTRNGVTATGGGAR